ncbi:MAG: hypothetical protein ABSB86_05450, partial [Bryobacteraceae bacterium]
MVLESRKIWRSAGHTQSSSAVFSTPLWKTPISLMDRVDYLVEEAVQIWVLLAELVDFLDG